MYLRARSYTLVALVFTGCAEVPKNAPSDAGHPQATISQTQGFEARTTLGGLIISENGNDVATIRTAGQNLESRMFINGGKNFITKSRGNHGPATVELWDSATGALKDKVMTSAIKDGQPAWAAPYAE